jgi:hypothetical protein
MTFVQFVGTGLVGVALLIGTLDFVSFIRRGWRL